MSPRVPEERHQISPSTRDPFELDRLHSRRELGRLRSRLDPECLFPLMRPIAQFFTECASRPRRGELLGMDVDARIGEVDQSPCVIEIEVGEDDVGDLRGVLPEGSDLVDRGAFRFGAKPEGPGEGTEQ